VELDGAAALVTGGASGIGAATLDRLRKAGARVAALDLQPAPGADLAVECDVGDEQEVVDAVARVAAEFGRLDVAVLAAGVASSAPILEMTADDWDRVQRVNLRGAFLSLRESARAMVGAGRGGALVAVTSVSGFLTDRRIASYTASKAGLAALVRVAARELGPYGIRVNAVAPGTTDTPMFAVTKALPGYHDRVIANTPLGRIGAPDDVADAIVLLVRAGWVTGQVVAADGGVSLYSTVDAGDDLDRRP
jgi:NAD(P)-dependent dehydrogenase (short-subunit alcohol dehydrogenase family)